MSKGVRSDATTADKKKDPTFKKKKRWPLLAAIIATILILSGFAYWYVTNVPDLESFMNGSYSHGEKAKFRAKVTEMELLETSYGDATLVYFDDYGTPFCFLGNHTGKYKEGKTVEVEVTFHRYDIDGLKIVMPEELILGCYLQLEEVFLGISHRGGIGLTGEEYTGTSEYYYINISTLMYPYKTFSTDLYDHALNRIYGYDYVDDGVEAGIGTGEGKYGKKGSFGGDCTEFTTMLYMNSIALCSPEVNCTYQEEDPGYLPDRIHLTDRNNDGNISLDDSYQIDMKPTRSRYDLNFYMFNICGINTGTNLIMNWHEGPFYSRNRLTYYSLGPAEEEKYGGNYSVRMPIHGVVGEAFELIDIDAYIAPRGYSPEHIFEGETYDGTKLSIDESHSPRFEVTVSFRDQNGNSLLDAGDYFLIEKMKKDSKYLFFITHPDYYRFFSFTYIVSQGLVTGDYPLITMNEPIRSNGNISINVTGVEAFFPELHLLDHILHIPEKNILLDTRYQGDEIYSDDGTIRFAINDTDDNYFFNKGDRIEIDGLEPGTEYRITIFDRCCFPLYELEAVA